jgi:hypothetical protein
MSCLPNSLFRLLGRQRFYFHGLHALVVHLVLGLKMPQAAMVIHLHGQYHEMGSNQRPLDCQPHGSTSLHRL